MTFVGPQQTSFEWLESSTDTAVLPIGAFEQHGHHLPLETDTVRAMYSGEHVARALNAALLPAIPYGTSLEHKGFRGTVSLTPEALTSIINAIVDELEQQSFTRLIIINGHGGNFAMFPCIRSINRADRPIKIIPVSPSAFYGRCNRTPEIHAGEAETSIMLAIGAPVGDDRRDEDCFATGFLQSDLNIFGVGRINKDGVWGFPSKASKEKGESILESMHHGMLTFIKQRMELLDEDPAYGGTHNQ